MKKTYLLIVSLVLVISLILAINVSSSMLIPANENALENGKAPDHSPVITRTQSGQWDLERVDFIHYAKPTSSGKPGKTETCYKLMGVKWSNVPVNYVINPVNSQALSADFITSAIFNSAETWDSETSQELFSDSYSLDTSAKYGIQDFKNVLEFGDYGNNNVIAITSVWFTRKGKQIVEFDQLYNTRFQWGDAIVNPEKMDLQNIATHELGHAIGLDDIYSASCSSVTMYGYSTEGETSKRTLEQPDTIGLQKMY